MAGKVALSMLKHMSTVDQATLDDECAGWILMIKPWLDMENEGLKSKFEALQARKHSGCQQKESDSAQSKSIKELCEAVDAVQHLIGRKGELTNKLLICSMEKMAELLAASNADGLGKLFLDLDSKLIAFLKTRPSLENARDESESEVIQKLVNDAETLVSASKMVLACQSGSLAEGLNLTVNSPSPNLNMTLSFSYYIKVML